METKFVHILSKSGTIIGDSSL